MPDKYTALWLSHSSISDFLECPRAYYLKHVYKDPGTKHKVKLATPSFSLGSAVHETLESLSVLQKDKRFLEPLMTRFDRAWEKVAGRRGGFADIDAEHRARERGRAMIRRVSAHPGPLANLAVKIKKDLPYFWIDEAENIILCGKVDWLEYMPETDSVHIIDFKTSRSEEAANSLQLPIYHLLVSQTQERPVARASYWYLDSSDAPAEQPLPDIDAARKKILDIGHRVKLARQLDRLECSSGKSKEGCRACVPYERIFHREAECVGVDGYNCDIYILPPRAEAEAEKSEIL